MTDDLDLDELAADLADFAPQEKKGGRSAREERIIAGFEEIQRFAEAHGRAPSHGESNDIFERLYALRLDRLRGLEECCSLLAPLDKQGLLAGVTPGATELVETMVGSSEIASAFKAAAAVSEYRVSRLLDAA